MITVSSALEQERIKAYVEAMNDPTTYTFVKKEGIKLFFDHGDEVAPDVAARAVREQMKVEPWGRVLYFNCAAV